MSPPLDEFGVSSATSHRSPGRSRARALVLALAINTGFFFVVLFGAILANSVTLLAEAAHMLTDSLSLGLALLASWIARWSADAKRTYGYHRVEVLGGLLNGLLLLGVVGYVLFEAFQRIRDPLVVDAPIVIVVGVVGLASNLAAAWVLLDHRHSINVEGAFLHLVADAAGSLAAVALGVALLFTDLHVLDPVFAVLVAALVLYSVRDLFADSLNILLQGTPREMDLATLTAALGEIPGVRDVHDVHVWAIDSSQTALSAHVVMGPDVEVDDTLVRAQTVAGGFGIDHATIQIESTEFTETIEFDCYPMAD